MHLSMIQSLTIVNFLQIHTEQIHLPSHALPGGSPLLSTSFLGPYFYGDSEGRFEVTKRHFNRQ